MKKTLIAAALALASMSSFASSYYLVVPVPGKTSTTAGINVALSGATLPSAVVGTPYAGVDLKPMLTVTGDPAYAGYGVKWSLASGSLPAGLTLNSNGTISGTPTAAGSGSFQVKATYKTKSGAQAYQILVGDIAVVLAAATPPVAQVGQAYSFDLKSLLTVTGDGAYQAGTGVTWSVVADTLPAGLQLKNDGTIAGTPTAGGNGSITARATYKSRNGDQTYQVVSLDIKVALAAATLPAATKNSQYPAYDFNNQLSVTGDPGYSAGKAQFTATGLPTGLSLSTAGVLSGTPTVKNPEGTPVTVTASYKNVTGQQTYTVVVNGMPIQVSQIAAGRSHTCAIAASSGGVVCWGDNSYGQLGVGTTQSQPSPVSINTLFGVKSISAGGFHTCAVTSSGGVKCWGYNGSGQLGDGLTSVQRTTPWDVSGLTSGVAKVAAGANHTCARTTAGMTKCWGANGSGQLGDGTTTQRNAPVVVSTLTSGVTDVSVGASHSCALLSTGAVKCWGENSSGQLGDSTFTQRLTPIMVTGIGPGTDVQVTSLSLGGYHSCAGMTMFGMNGYSCWGSNNSGQLGDGSYSSSPTPRNALGSGNRIAAGDMHTCLVTDWNAVQCWGSGNYGQLGYGSYGSQAQAYNDVSNVTEASSVSAGGSHTCAVTVSGTWCWGQNFSGQVGDGTTVAKPAPVLVTN